MKQNVALVRGIPDSFASALSAAPRPHAGAGAIDVDRARQQHAAYIAALTTAGLAVTALPADESAPDCVFIEDTAVVVGDTALITRPGAPSRRDETGPVADALRQWLHVEQMEAPATLDGGDVMRVGQTLYVGRSARTNAAGVAELVRVFAPRAMHVVPVALPAHVLHLKCVVSPLGDDRVLLADDSVPPDVFAGCNVIRVPATEQYAANVVAVSRHALVARGFPRTRDALTAAGLVPIEVDTSEAAKADGSLTCQSILIAAS